MYKMMVDQTGSELERAQVCDFVGALILRRARDRDVRRSPRRPEGVQGRDRQGADAQGDDGDAARGGAGPASFLFGVASMASDLFRPRRTR